MNTSLLTFTESELWKKARFLKNDIYQLASKLPIAEKFRLSDQLIRASRSVTSNIAEGHGRYTFKDQIHFCNQARGSLSEAFNHLSDALDCNFISKSEFDELEKKVIEVGALLNGYIKYLKKRLVEKYTLPIK